MFSMIRFRSRNIETIDSSLEYFGINTEAVTGWILIVLGIGLYLFDSLLYSHWWDVLLFSTFIPGGILLYLSTMKGNCRFKKIVSTLCILMFIELFSKYSFIVDWSKKDFFFFENIHHYRQICAEIKEHSPNAIKHFPDMTSIQDESFTMFYKRKRYRKNASFVIRYRLNDGDLEGVIESFKIDPEEIPSRFKEMEGMSLGDPQNNLWEALNHGFSLNIFDKSLINSYYLHIPPNKIPDDFYYGDGIAVSKARNEVMYWLTY